MPNVPPLAEAAPITCHHCSVGFLDGSKVMDGPSLGFMPHLSTTGTASNSSLAGHRLRLRIRLNLNAVSPSGSHAVKIERHRKLFFVDIGPAIWT